jgi:hypothetical protein
MSKKKEPVLVVIIKNNVVDEAKLFSDVKKAEECFTLECLNIGAKKDDMDVILDEGYYQDFNCTAVCLTHPTVL